MSRVVLSIGSNLGDRLARLQAAVDGLGDSVKAVSPVYETDAWGGVSQPAFLNAVVIADDDRLDAHGWLRRAQALELDNERVRTKKWGPRTLDVDLICCFGVPLPGHGISGQGISGHGISAEEIFSHDAELTLPHPFAHERVFVLLPWLAVDPAAQLTVAGQPKPVQELLNQLEPAERDGVRPTALTLTFKRSRH
ncbi:MAG: 2-amino-4-hydroxy-6-hydroxymethyldihydropteridine diphosphokinase [Mycobacterium sp.]